MGNSCCVSSGIKGPRILPASIDFQQPPSQCNSHETRKGCVQIPSGDSVCLYSLANIFLICSILAKVYEER